MYYFPCPQSLDRASSIRVKLYSGQKPVKLLPPPVAAKDEEEDPQALVSVPKQAPQHNDAIDTGVTGNYTVTSPSHILLVVKQLIET